MKASEKFIRIQKKFTNLEFPERRFFLKVQFASKDIPSLKLNIFPPENRPSRKEISLIFRGELLVLGGVNWNFRWLFIFFVKKKPMVPV